MLNVIEQRNNSKPERWCLFGSCGSILQMSCCSSKEELILILKEICQNTESSQGSHADLYLPLERANRTVGLMHHIFFHITRQPDAVGNVEVGNLCPTVFDTYRLSKDCSKPCTLLCKTPILNKRDLFQQHNASYYQDRNISVRGWGTQEDWYLMYWFWLQICQTIQSRIWGIY